jgi:hypothetical protein
MGESTFGTTRCIMTLYSLSLQPPNSTAFYDFPLSANILGTKTLNFCACPFLRFKYNFTSSPQSKVSIVCRRYRNGPYVRRSTRYWFIRESAISPKRTFW